MTSIFDCIIVGSGVAGMTSAIYLKRAGLKILLLEKSAPGGQINMSPNVENYPGFKSIVGAILATNIFDQTQALDVEYKYGNVLSVKKNNDIFKIKTDIEEYSSKTVIIATGRKVSKLNLEFEEQLIGKGISYCALCDANFFKDATVGIIGSDYKMLEEAIYLANICKTVNIFCSKDNIEKSDIILEKINDYSNIKIYYNSSIKKLNISNDKLDSINIITNKGEEEVKCSGLFVSNYNSPDINFENDIKRDKNNYIIVSKEMCTNIEGLFACGDVVKKTVYQLTTTVSDATIAANSTLNYLMRKMRSYE